MSAMLCPMCGDSMSKDTGGCSQCPIGHGCSMLCCDTCGYKSVAPKSQVVDLFKLLLGKRKKRPPEAETHGA